MSRQNNLVTTKNNKATRKSQEQFISKKNTHNAYAYSQAHRNNRGEGSNTWTNC